MSNLNKYLLVLSLSSASHIFAIGGADTGGIDNQTIESGSAWFLGDRAVSYCIDMSQNFGVSLAEADSTIQKVARSWESYRKSHKVFENHWSDIWLASELVRKPQCDGSEDIAFYLGVTNPDVELAKAKHSNPTAISFLQQYNLNAGWGKGFIWVAPQESVFPGAHYPRWSTPCALEGVLLHEWGHVLGNGHVDGTIMNTNLIQWIQLSETNSAQACQILTKIDHSRELVTAPFFNFEGAVDNSRNAQNAEAIFKLLTGVQAN